MAVCLSSKAPRCVACLRRVTGCSINVLSPIFQQTRGKKKLAKLSTVNVQLLQNIPGYGRRGSIIPATAGLMRNVWFPRKMAEYVPVTKLKELGIDADTVARDPTFQSARERKLARKALTDLDKGKSPLIESLEEMDPKLSKVEQLTPDEATAVLERLVPAVLPFYRTPSGAVTQSPPKSLSPSIPATSALSAAATMLATNQEASERPEKIGIYGSLSTSDIAANLKAILADDATGAYVGLTRENISFVEQEQGQELDRVRHLGTFQIHIALKGASQAVRRSVSILSQG